MFMLLIEPLHFALKLHQIDAFNLKKNVQHLPPPRRSEVRPPEPAGLSGKKQCLLKTK